MESGTEVVASTEGSTYLRAGLLDQDNSNKNDGQNYLDVGQ